MQTLIGRFVESAVAFVLVIPKVGTETRQPTRWNVSVIVVFEREKSRLLIALHLTTGIIIIIFKAGEQKPTKLNS